MLKHFFSLEFFKELKVLLIIEFIIILLGWALLNTPSVHTVILEQDIKPFNLLAFLTTLFIWVLSCVADTKKYFNLATLIATGFMCYLSFWYLLEVVFRLK